MWVRARPSRNQNHPSGLASKGEMRRNVLAEISPAHVFDAFCGDGVMYRQAWHAAAAAVSSAALWMVGLSSPPRAHLSADISAMPPGGGVQDYAAAAPDPASDTAPEPRSAG